MYKGSPNHLTIYGFPALTAYMNPPVEIKKNPNAWLHPRPIKSKSLNVGIQMGQYFGHLMRINWLIEKDPDAGKDWRQEEKGTTEDEMVEWHHRLNGHEFEQAPGVGDGQRSLACCSPQGHKELDMTEWLNWTEIQKTVFFKASQVIPVCSPGWELLCAMI